MGQLLKALRSQTHELSSYLASGDALVEVAMMAHVKHQVSTCWCIRSPHALCLSSASLGRGMCLGQDPRQWEGLRQVLQHGLVYVLHGWKHEMTHCLLGSPQAVPIAAAQVIQVTYVSSSGDHQCKAQEVSA